MEDPGSNPHLVILIMGLKQPRKAVVVREKGGGTLWALQILEGFGGGGCHGSVQIQIS